MSDERSQFARKIDERTFRQSRRGYDRTEVKSYLEDLEQAFRELEGHSRRLSQKVAELEQELSEARAVEKVSVDNAMMAVFDAKDRILERARRKADDLEEEARLEAGRIRQAAIAEAGGAGATGEIAAARAQADEIIANARKEADRLREEVAVTANDGLEADLADMGERLRRAHDENAAVRAELDEARKRIVELEDTAAAADTSEQMEQRFAELEGMVSAARADKERLQVDLANSQEELAKAQADRNAAQQEATQADTARSQLQTSLEEARAELDEAKALVAATADQTDIESLQAELSSAQARIDELSDADRMRTDAETRLAEAESRVADAETRAAEAESRVADAETRAAEAESRVADAETKAAEGESRVADAETKAAEAKSRVGDVESLLVDAERRAAEAESKVVAADARKTEAEEAAAAVQAKLAASEVVQTGLEESAARDVEQAEFAGTMTAFEARTVGSFAHRESIALIAETARAQAPLLPGSVGAADNTEAEDEAERIIAAAREEAEAIKVEAEEHADQRAAKVIARAREEADQVRQTVATLTAQAEDARSAALRSKLEAEDLAEAQKAMSDARDQIIATAENRAEEITRDAERSAANLRSEAEAALAEAHAEAKRIVTAAADEADRQATEATPVEVGNPEPELPSEQEPEPADVIEAESLEPEPIGSGDELAALLAEAERDLAANERLREERERLDAQEAELAAQRAEAILLAATRDGGGVDEATSTDTAGATVESGAQELDASAERTLTSIDAAVEEAATADVETDVEVDAAVDAPPPHIDFNDILDMDDADSDAAVEADDEDEEDPADLLTALLEEVAPTVVSDDDDPTAETQGGDPKNRVAVEKEVITDLSGGPQPRVAWPTPVDRDEEPEEGPDPSDRQSRYRSRSAQLPRLGRQAKSNTSTMANLRKKSNGIDDDE